MEAKSLKFKPQNVLKDLMGGFMNSSYEKGVRLEKLIADLFRSKGYDVWHNVRLTGRSGVEHQIDVYAEFRAPLHVSRIIVECKSYDQPVDKDVVMKLIHEVQDLGADRGILVTTSYFTPDAVSTVRGHNIDLWDGAKLRDLLKEILPRTVSLPSNVFYILPAVSADQALETVDRELRGFFSRKGDVESSLVVYYPFYELDIDASIYEKRFLSTSFEKKIISTTVIVDPVLSRICHYEPNLGMVGVLEIPMLSDEETRVFRLLMRREGMTVSALASLLSCSTAKARKMLQGLVAKGVAEIVKRYRSIFYRLNIRIPPPSSLGLLSSHPNFKMGEPEEMVRINPELSMKDVERLVRLLWEAVIKNYRLIYYPYYACKVFEKGKRYIRAVDMLTNRIDETVSQLMTNKYFQLPF